MTLQQLWHGMPFCTAVFVLFSEAEISGCMFFFCFPDPSSAFSAVHAELPGQVLKALCRWSGWLRIAAGEPCAHWLLRTHPLLGGTLPEKAATQCGQQGAASLRLYPGLSAASPGYSVAGWSGSWLWLNHLVTQPYREGLYLWLYRPVYWISSILCDRWVWQVKGTEPSPRLQEVGTVVVTVSVTLCLFLLHLLDYRVADRSGRWWWLICIVGHR